MTKTKIVTTLGPATSDRAVIESLINEGASVFRINFSHGDVESHTQLLNQLNQIRNLSRQSTAVLGDLCGPKIRTGIIQGDDTILKEGHELTIYNSRRPGTSHDFGTNYDCFVQDVDLDDTIMIDDGNIELKVIGKCDQHLTCRVIVGGPIYSNKGINLPDTDVKINSITDHDWRCIDWAISHQLNFLAISFVRSAAEILQLKQYLSEKGSDIRVIAKIEKPQAIDAIDSILEASDGIMIARGDLGVEMDLATVPLIQKKITRMCREVGKPCIVATQMLQSMIDKPVPTRAEVSDISNAVFDYTDAVMLSGETAVGEYPIAAVQWMSRIACTTEEYIDKTIDYHPRARTCKELELTAAFANSVADMVDHIDAKLIVAWSESGATAELFSNARIDIPIIAISSDNRICQKMSLMYGVIPFRMDPPESVPLFYDLIKKLILEQNAAVQGDEIVMVTGKTLAGTGSTNTVSVMTL